jgi:hypothetical protein
MNPLALGLPLTFAVIRDHDGPTLGEYRARRQAPEAVLWELRDLVHAQAGHILRLPRSWRKRTVTARYAYPSRVLNADEIAKLKNNVSQGG